MNIDSQVFFDWSTPALNSLDESTAVNLIPSTREEIVSTVRATAAAKRRLRVVGAGHSWSPIAKSDDLQMSLSNYKVQV